MSRLRKISTHKKKIVLLVSISLVVIGFTPQFTIRIIRDLNNPYTIEPLALEAEDGTHISSIIYTPIGEKSHGGIVVSHRYWGDKLLMQPLSVELVRRGFTVISIDFRGHGASGGQFIRSQLLNDMKAAVDYMESELPYITQIGVIGHSLGAMVAAELARAYPDKINATVAIGSLGFNPSGISNLLMAIGGIEPYISEEKFLNALRIYTGEQNVSVGKLYYGDFVGGNNTMVFVGANFNHLMEIIDPKITYQTIQWFEQVFNGVPADDIILTEWFLEFFSLIFQLGAIILNFILVIYLSDYIFKGKNKDLERDLIKESKTRLISYYALMTMGFAVIAFFSLLSIPGDADRFNPLYSIIFISIGVAFGVFLLFIFLIMSSEQNFSFKIFFMKFKMLSSSFSKHSVIFGITAALLFIISPTILWNLPPQNILIEGGNFGIMIGLIFISFPFFLMKEFYFRIIQRMSKKSKIYREYINMVFAGIFMDNLIIFAIFSVGWINVVYMGDELLYLSVWIRFSIIQNILVTWIYIYSGRNILGSTVFSSIIYAWISVIIFPSFGFV